MRRAAALRPMLLAMRRAGLIVMLAVLSERGRTRDKADNRGRNQKFAHQIHPGNCQRITSKLGKSSIYRSPGAVMVSDR